MAKYSTKADAKPSRQHYPKDWLNEPGLLLSSLASRGLWADMLDLMWLSPKRGKLLKPNGSKMEAKDLARLRAAPEQEVRECLAELGENEVYSIDDDGAIYSRRMVREAAAKEHQDHISEVRAEAGRRGGKASGRVRRAKQKPANEAASSSSPTASPTALEALPARAREAEMIAHGQPATPEQVDHLRALMDVTGTSIQAVLAGTAYERRPNTKAAASFAIDMLRKLRDRQRRAPETFKERKGRNTDDATARILKELIANEQP